MKITTETITPALARDYLERNKKNRRISKRGVAEYADQIRRGNWKLNGESIKFAKDGSLVDGQHRLHAIVEANTAVEMTIARELEKEVIKTLDIGRKRTNADHLAIHGIETQADLITTAAAIRIILQFASGKYEQKHTYHLSPSDAIAFVEQHRDILHADERVPTAIGKLMPRSVAVALYFLFSKIDRTKADLFFLHVAEGADLPAGNPALTLRNALLFMVGAKSGRGAKRQVIAYVCRAFDSYLNNETSQRLRYDAAADIPLPVKKER
jgi:hypothetical protein